jgi:hypothetical protein
VLVVCEVPGDSPSYLGREAAIPRPRSALQLGAYFLRHLRRDDNARLIRRCSGSSHVDSLDNGLDVVAYADNVDAALERLTDLPGSHSPLK